MSTLPQKVTDENAALQYMPAQMKARRPSGKKTYKPHLATKIKWVLEDSEGRMIEAQCVMTKVLDWAEQERALRMGDTEALARLGQLDHYLARLALTVTATEREIAASLAASKKAKTNE